MVVGGDGEQEGVVDACGGRIEGKQDGRCVGVDEWVMRLLSVMESKSEAVVMRE